MMEAPPSHIKNTPREATTPLPSINPRDSITRMETPEPLRVPAKLCSIMHNDSYWKRARVRNDVLLLSQETPVKDLIKAILGSVQHVFPGPVFPVLELTRKTVDLNVGIEGGSEGDCILLREENCIAVMFLLEQSWDEGEQPQLTLHLGEVPMGKAKRRWRFSPL